MKKNLFVIFVINLYLVNSIYSKYAEFTCLTKYLKNLNSNNIFNLGVEFEKCILTRTKYHHLYKYKEVLKKYGIKWEFNSMSKVDVSKLEPEPILALIIGAFRAERFNEGIINDFINNKCFTKWLLRLKQIDDKL